MVGETLGNYGIRDPWALALRWDAAFDSVREGPRADDIMQRIYPLE